MPHPTKGESQSEFVGRFMGSAEAKKSFPKQSQRAAVAYSMWRHRKLAKKKRLR